MEDIRETLLTHSRYIRDTLLPLVANDQGSGLNYRDLSILRAILNDVNATPVTLELLRYSRIAKALAIITTDTRWPADTAMKASRILQKWEKPLGRVDDLRIDLWGPGGRLEGLKKAKVWWPGTVSKIKDIGCSWSIDGYSEPSKPYAVGHLGFVIGAWWIKSIAAVRDGIIGALSKGTTADKDGAYAVILKDGEETPINEHGLTLYTTSATGRSVLQLTKPTANDRRNVIRVLRASKLRSPLAPAAGLRYDGLYQVIGYGIKLSKNEADEDVWTYTFTLQRECQQASIKEALCHPTADELDDFRDYRRAKAAGEIPELTVEVFSSAASLLTIRDGAGVERHPSKDSGYHSIGEELERISQKEKVVLPEGEMMRDEGLGPEA